MEDDAIDLSGDGRVLKKILSRPKPDDISPSESRLLVDVRYEGVLAEMSEVSDTTHEDSTIFSFEIGTGYIISAWAIALRTMKVFFFLPVCNSLSSSAMNYPFSHLCYVGENAKITCKSGYTYGSSSSPPDILPN
ncbi:hypothetical protein SAY87_001096 [Trapa incisa]|uniref:peptidylprolyl isomerase n=1 Tax=Trapa incisa TaxID=236973 RepID=A0AAN7JHE2_9MYRT|nr:hypothetical protein SAY87_001096 [Trapa incisa]